MTRVAPIIAMLWENWRLTRVEAAQRFALGLVVGTGALVLSDDGATIAFWMLVLLHSMIWFSIAKLNGGRFADGYKPGFPFYLLYTRPIPTTMIVAVAMAYDVISCVALYLASAALLGLVFDQPLPLLSVSLCLGTAHILYACIQWSTRSRIVQWLGSFVIFLPLFFMLKNNVATPLHVEFSLVENLVLVLFGVASFVLTVAGVARQRRGDSVAAASPQKDLSGGYPDWLVSLFQFRCPTTSATRAQLWFELKASGLPVLMIGLGLAILIFLVCAISTAYGNLRFFAFPVAMLALPLVMFGLGSNAFGIRRKQGRTYASAFELTTPCGTAKLAGLKVLVRTACVLLALIAIGASLWVSSSLVGEWGQFVLNNNKDVLPDLLRLRQKLSDDFAAVTGYTYAALAIVVSITVASMVAWQAAYESLRVRFPRLLILVQWLPSVWGLATILLSLAHRGGMISTFFLRAFFSASFWISVAAFAVAAIYLLWRGFEQRVLTIPYASGAIAISLAFGAAWLAGISANGIVWLLWPLLLILMLGVLAPWSLSRVRHT